MSLSFSFAQLTDPDLFKSLDVLIPTAIKALECLASIAPFDPWWINLILYHCAINVDSCALARVELDEFD
jgi:hypothetical protein